MKNTGERVIPGVSSKRLQEEHLDRYEFVKKYCNGKVVLDVACGTGYGSYELSKLAKKVYGVDSSKEAIDFANANYKSENLTFIQSNCIRMDFEEKKFDVVISFETIEHLVEEDRCKFYKLIKKYLKDDGVIIFSTPNKRVNSPYTAKPLNEHHVIEFTKKLLENELSNEFFIQKWFGQRYILNFLLIKVVRKFTRLIEIIFRKDFGIYSTRPNPEVGEWDKSFVQPRTLLVVMKKR